MNLRLLQVLIERVGEVGKKAKSYYLKWDKCGANGGWDDNKDGGEKVTRKFNSSSNKKMESLKMD